MTCAPFDLRDYFFDALSAPDRAAVSHHLTRCSACAAELDRLRLTQLSLSALAEEEIPRRIAFVSDKVFTPSPVRRWWESFWLSGARLGSAAAVLLAGAILVHAFRPSPAIVGNSPHTASGSETVIITPTALQARIDRSVNTAVSRAVAETEERSNARSDARFARLSLENARQKQMIQRAGEMLETLDRHSRVLTIADNRPISDPAEKGQ